MHIFVVRYTESERNDFCAFKISDQEQWEKFLIAKLPEHTCGYLVTDEDSLRDVPHLQLSKYHELVRGEPLSRGRRSDFLLVLEETAIDLPDDIVRAFNKKGVKMTEAATKTKPEAADGEKKTRQRFSVDPDKKITVKATENPRRKGSATYEIFNKYKTGMTVKQALDAGIRMVDIKADMERGHIEVK